MMTSFDLKQEDKSSSGVWVLISCMTTMPDYDSPARNCVERSLKIECCKLSSDATVCNTSANVFQNEHLPFWNSSFNISKLLSQHMRTSFHQFYKVSNVENKLTHAGEQRQIWSSGNVLEKKEERRKNHKIMFAEIWNWFSVHQKLYASCQNFVSILWKSYISTQFQPFKALLFSFEIWHNIHPIVI